MRLQLGEHGHSGLCHTPHKPIEDRTGQLVTQEIVGKLQGELSSSDRAGNLRKREKNAS